MTHLSKCHTSSALGSALQVRIMEAPMGKLLFSGLEDMATTGFSARGIKLKRLSLFIYSYFNLRCRIKASSLQDKTEGEYGILMTRKAILIVFSASMSISRRQPRKPKINSNLPIPPFGLVPYP